MKKNFLRNRKAPRLPRGPARPLVFPRFADRITYCEDSLVDSRFFRL